MGYLYGDDKKNTKSPKKPNYVLVFFLSLVTIISLVVILVITSKNNTRIALEELDALQNGFSSPYNSIHSPYPSDDSSLCSNDSDESNNSYGSIFNIDNPIIPTIPTISITATPSATQETSFINTPNSTSTPTIDYDSNSSLSLLQIPTSTHTPVPSSKAQIIATPEPIIEATVVPTQIPTPEPTTVPTPTPLLSPTGYHYEYYKSLLPENVQSAFDEYVSGVNNYLTEIPVQCSSDYMKAFCDALLYDHPELFWIGNSTSFHTTTSSPGVLYFEPTYFFGKDTSTPCQNTIDSVAQYLLSSTSGQSTYNKIKATYEYIICNTSYGDIDFDQRCYSVFMYNRSVCAGYSAAFKLLMDHLEIPSIIVSGNNGNHAWNMVYLDGNWYHIDVTWGDPKCSNGRQKLTYEYFLLSDSEILRSHSFDHDYPYPEAPITCTQKANDNLKSRYTS